ncbi:MAG: cytochrome c peroxidase [Desulfurivibrio sp.]|nr:cytochrome c peroxidase [Desulfurivibrio sp.]
MPSIYSFTSRTQAKKSGRRRLLPPTGKNLLLAGLLLFLLLPTIRATGGPELENRALESEASEPITPIPRSIDFDRAKAELGRELFHDPLLSLDRTISCASCHDLDSGGHDPRPVSLGIKGREGSMNAPTVFNAVFNFRQFWNGRAADLREQADGPLQNPVEMGMSREEVEQRLTADGDYRRRFRAIYGGEEVRFTAVLDALAEFQRALITPGSRFDQYLRGEITLAPHEYQGYLTFKELGCVTCHNGVNLGGNSFQRIDIIKPRELDHEDLEDRYAVTGKPTDRGVFKVPTLRNIVLTAPYLHDGSAADLEQVLSTMARHGLGVELKDKQIHDLISFFNTLTAPRPDFLNGAQ